MLSDRTLQDIVLRIHSCPEFRNCLVGYYGGGRCRLLFEPTTTLTGNEGRVAIIIEEQAVTDAALINELKRFSLGNGESPTRAPNPQVVTNRSRIAPEMAGAGIACGLTIVSTLGVVAGVAGELPSGGASTFLIYAGWAGLVTGGVQCLNGLVRVGAIFSDSDGNSLQRWDSNYWYSNGILLVDAIGVVAGVASLPFQARNLFAVLSRQKAFVARGISFQSLKAMNRAERLRVISEIFEQASRTPEGREALIKAAREAGLGPKTLQATNGLSVQASQKIAGTIKAETARRLMSSVRDVLTTAGGITGSAMPADWVGSASGSVNTAASYVIHAVEVN